MVHLLNDPPPKVSLDSIHTDVFVRGILPQLSVQSIRLLGMTSRSFRACFREVDCSLLLRDRRRLVWCERGETSRATSRPLWWEVHQADEAVARSLQGLTATQRDLLKTQVISVRNLWSSRMRELTDSTSNVPGIMVFCRDLFSEIAIALGEQDGFAAGGNDDKGGRRRSGAAEGGEEEKEEEEKEEEEEEEENDPVCCWDVVVDLHTQGKVLLDLLNLFAPALHRSEKVHRLTRQLKSTLGRVLDVMRRELTAAEVTRGG